MKKILLATALVIPALISMPVYAQQSVYCHAGSSIGGSCASEHTLSTFANSMGALLNRLIADIGGHPGPAIPGKPLEPTIYNALVAIQNTVHEGNLAEVSILQAMANAMGVVQTEQGNRAVDTVMKGKAATAEIAQKPSRAECVKNSAQQNMIEAQKDARAKMGPTKEAIKKRINNKSPEGASPIKDMAYRSELLKQYITTYGEPPSLAHLAAPKDEEQVKRIMELSFRAAPKMPSIAEDKKSAAFKTYEMERAEKVAFMDYALNEALDESAKVIPVAGLKDSLANTIALVNGDAAAVAYMDSGNGTQFADDGSGLVGAAYAAGTPSGIAGPQLDPATLLADIPAGAEISMAVYCKKMKEIVRSPAYVSYIQSMPVEEVARAQLTLMQLNTCETPEEVIAKVSESKVAYDSNMPSAPDPSMITIDNTPSP